MPTAILSSYTGDGFIVAADGMAQDKDGRVTTRSRRKIFQFGGNKWLAYAFAGKVAMGPDQGPEIWFDFRERIKEAIQGLSITRYATLLGFAESLAKRTQRELRETCKSSKIKFNDPMDNVLDHVFIDGYFRTLPESVAITFHRHNGRFAQPEVVTQALAIGIPRRTGSEMMNSAFHNKHPLFFNERYFGPLKVPVPHLSEAMVKAVIESRAYIKACESAEARKLDSFCESIGGHIHMAMVTPKAGFRWVPGFKPKGVR